MPSLTTSSISMLSSAGFGLVPKSWLFANGQSVVRSFDLDGRMTANSIGSIGYDAAGRITQQNESSKTYGYDALDRLTSYDNGSTPHAYAFDATGNRTSQTIGSASYTFATAGTSNRLTSITTGGVTTNYAFDANGSLTSDGTHGFTYDAAGRMSTAGGLGTYLYNGLGQRVKKTASGATTLFAYDETGKLLGEYDSVGNVLQETVWLGDIPIAVLKPTGTYYVHSDHLNTPRLIYNQSAQLAWSWDVVTFGGTAPNENPSGLGTFTYNLRFPGQYFDSETGLHYNLNRDYDPKTGRYIESDPIGLIGGINTYGYAFQNPLRYVDPTGELVFVLPALPAIGAALAEVGSALAGGLALGAILATPGDTNIYLDYPDRPRTKGKVRCNCKCYANTQAGGPSGTSAEGSGEGSSIGDAQRDAEKEAKKKLGCQAEHCQCKCVDSKGEKSATGGR